jgi:hypothetical protein
LPRWSRRPRSWSVSPPRLATHSPSPRSLRVRRSFRLGRDTPHCVKADVRRPGAETLARRPDQASGARLR